MPPNHDPRPTPRSNPQIDAAGYQILYEMERRMDEKFSEARQQYKDDIAAALAPVLARLDDGNRRFDDHSDKIKAAAKQSVEKATALEKKKEGSWLLKVAEKVVLPIAIAALSAMASVWLMVQIKLIALADTTTNTPTIAQPKQ
jgi:hypothetical protein